MIPYLLPLTFSPDSYPNITSIVLQRYLVPMNTAVIQYEQVYLTRCALN